MEIQLRDYQIRPGRMDAWIAAWKVSVVPLRERLGFEVLGAWADTSGDRFVWLLGFSGPEGFQTADDSYYASPERAALRPDPADLIAEARHTMVTSVL